jgi:hypothetical protein
MTNVSDLKDALGPVGYENGHGDYTKEKYQQPDMTIDEIDILLKGQDKLLKISIKT